MNMTDGIILLAKQSGPTSFASLSNVKKALKSSKVGHTGTLDSFAEGLLVVCTGRLTKLAGNITAFNKDYEAVIKFGEETDTLEFTGEVIKSEKLPSKEALENSLKKFTGEITQTPPAFSAVHINGKRASDLARKGETAELPKRKVTVFKSEIKELKLNKENLVEYARIYFSVSKGTYIRSLARDIANECNSAAHLTALRRTKIGNFELKDAAGFSSLKDFTIDNAIKSSQEFLKKQNDISQKNDEKLQEEIKKSIVSFTSDTARLCGFEVAQFSETNSEKDFYNGKKLHKSMFQDNLSGINPLSQIAVFSKENIFSGLIFKDENSRLSYKFVISR